MTMTVDGSTEGRGRFSWLGRMLPEPGPGRRLVFCTGVASLGNGLYMTGGAVYFVHKVGLSPGQVGLGLSVAGILALPLGLPVGYLADRFGPRGTTALLALGKAAMLLAAMFVHSFLAYVVVVGALGVAENTGHVARGAMVAGIMGREGRVRLSAYMRSVFNGGFAVASLGAGIVIAFDTTPAYLALFWGNAIAMVAVSGLYMTLPRVPGVRPERRKSGGARPMLDLPYLVVAQVTGLGRIGPTIVAVGLPVWLITHTSAPRPLAAWLWLINTLIVVFLQVQVARDADTVPGASKLQRWTFMVLAVACVIVGFSQGVPGWAAGLIMAVAVILFTFGEIWGEAARWGLRYELAPGNAQGQYGGIFAVGDAVALVAGPTLVTAVPDHLGLAGWVLLTAIFLGALALSGPVIRWAVRTRPAVFEAVQAQEA